MISFINSWTQGIVVSVIISGIIEMLIPKGNMKKYINVIIGIYILFSIVSPIFSKFLNKDIEQILDIEKYAKQIENSEKAISQTLEANNSRTIKDIYVDNLENDIKNKVNDKGYETKELYIKVKEDETYTIEEINLTIKENNELNNSKTNKIQIDDIIVSKKNINNEENSLTKNEDMQDYLAQVYQLDRNIIKVYQR